MKPNFFYFLLDKLKNHWQQAADGSINTVPFAFIKSEPIGWKELSIEVDVDNTYFGIKKSISVALQYVFDGAAILRYLIFKRGGFNEEVYLVIAKLNHETDNYEQEYYGRLAMDTAVNDPNVGVTVNAKEGGFQADLDALQDTIEELALDNTNPDVLRLLFDGVDLFDTYNYTIFQSQTSNRQCYFTVPLIFVNNEGDSVGIIKGGQTYEEMDDDAAKDNFIATSSNDFFEPAIILTNVAIAGSISVTQYGIPQFDIALRSSKGKYLLIADNQSIGDGNTKVYSFSFTVNLEPGERFFLMGVKDSPPLHANILQFNETTFNIKFKSRNTPSTAGVLTLGNALDQIVKKWNPLYSVVWRADSDNIVCFSGMSLRQQKNPVLKESFKSLFQKADHLPLSVNIVGNTMYIDNRVQRYTSNTSTVLFNLGDVANLRISPIQENLFNTVKIGYTDQKTEERNGIYVFNSESQFAFPSPNNKEENRVSQAITDPYVIEFNRGKLNNKDTTDDSADNSTYFADIIKSQSVSGKYSISWTASTKTFVILGGALLTVPDLFELVVDDLNSDFNYLIFTVVSRTIVGANLEIVVNEMAPATLALLASAAISVPAKLYREVYDVLEGVPTPNIDGPGALFNIRLSPAHKLRNWGRHYASIFYQQREQKVHFKSGLRNVNLAVTSNGVRIAENADIYISDLGQPYFLNYWAEFLANVPMTFSKQFDLINGAAEILIRYHGFELSALVYGKMSAKPATNEPQPWKVWFSAKNSLDTLLALSDTDLQIVSDMANNTISWSRAYSPINWVYNEYNKGDRYKYYNSDEDMICNRNKQFGSQPFWAQKWETTADYISQPFITKGIGKLELFVYDLKGVQIRSYLSSVIANATIRNNQTLQQFDIQASDFDEGYYQFAIKANGIILIISEIQHFLEVHENTMALEYFNSYNKNGGYFKSDTEQWRPMIRIDAVFGNTISQGTATDYDSEVSFNTIDGSNYSTIDLRYENIPDQEQRRNDAILRLNNISIDGERLALPSESKWEIERFNGYPFISCTINLRYVSSTEIAAVTDTGAAEDAPMIIGAFDVPVFGRGPGLIEVDISGG